VIARSLRNMFKHGVDESDIASSRRIRRTHSPVSGVKDSLSKGVSKPTELLLTLNDGQQDTSIVRLRQTSAVCQEGNSPDSRIRSQSQGEV